ncbi:MAG: GxxExxY protein [Spirochaetaceae bacterium]|nr:GxxExxY protein [Spirochaetaceae bacterium]
MKKFIYKEEFYSIRSALYGVYNRLGCGLLESVYLEALEQELCYRNIPFSSQKK